MRAHQAMVFRTLGRLLGSAQGLDDLAQEVFLRLYRALGRFRGDAELATYLYRITVNVANDALRMRGKVRLRDVSLQDESEAWTDRLAHPGESAEQTVRKQEFRAAVEQALTQLSPVERAALVLRHQEEQSYEAIAEALAIPVNTVRTHLFRGRGKLRTLLAAYAPQAVEGTR